MIQIKVNQETNIIETVNYGNDKIDGFIEIQSIPEPQEKEGYYPIAYYRNGQVVYEYEPLPPVPDPPAPEPPIEPTNEELRRDAYEKEVDPHVIAYTSYMMEGKTAEAEREKTIALTNKEEIRKQYPEEAAQ